jgi:hypothetical protein
MKIPTLFFLRPFFLAAALCALVMPVRLSALMAGDSTIGTDTPTTRLTTAFSGVGTVNGCTCTAISSDAGGTWVLTAAHAAGSSQNTTVTFVVNGVTYNYTSSAVYVCSDYNSTTHDYDVALIYIPNDLSSLITTYSLYTGTAASLVGRTVTLVGFGYSGYGDLGQNTSYAKAFRSGKNVIDAVGYLNSSTECVFYEMDFDAPATYGTNGGSLGNGVETTLCVGDSGGPAFVYLNGQYYLAGVNTLVSSATDIGKYDTYAFGITSASIYSWVEETMAAVPEPSQMALALGLGALVPLALRRLALRAKR